MNRKKARRSDVFMALRNLYVLCIPFPVTQCYVTHEYFEV